MFLKNLDLLGADKEFVHGGFCARSPSTDIVCRRVVREGHFLKTHGYDKMVEIKDKNEL